MRSIKYAKSMIKKIRECHVKSLSGWETSFLASIEAKLDSGRCLSDKQCNVLENIYKSKARMFRV